MLVAQTKRASRAKNMSRKTRAFIIRSDYAGDRHHQDIWRRNSAPAPFGRAQSVSLLLSECFRGAKSRELMGISGDRFSVP